MLVENLPVPFDRRVWQEAKAILAMGFRVHVICPRTEDYRASFEELEGVQIHRFKARYEARRWYGYTLEYGSALCRMYGTLRRIAKRERVSVIHACNPPDLLYLVAAPFVRRSSAVYIFDQHDVGPEVVLAKGHKRGSALHRLALFAERQTFRLAELSIATNESYREIAIRRGGMQPDAVFIVRSAPEAGKFGRAQPSTRFHGQRRHLVAYLGVMGQQDGVDLLLEAAAQVVYDLGFVDIHFALAGSGPELKALKRLAQTLGLDGHLSFLGRISDEDLAELLASADVCVNPDPVNPLNDISTMNKVLEYMAAGRPIVQFDVREGRRSAREASVYVPGNDVNAFAEAIVNLLRDPERRARMGEYGRKRFAEELSWEQQVPTLREAYRAAQAKVECRTSSSFDRDA